MRIQHVRKRGLAGLQHGIVVGDEVSHQADDLTPQGVLIDAFHHAIPDHDPALDHYGLHRAAAFRIDELPRRAVVGQVRDVVKIDENQIRLVAGPDGAETIGETSRTRVADGCMPQNPRARDRGRAPAR